MQSSGLGEYKHSDWMYPYSNNTIRIHYLYRIFDDSNNPNWMPSSEWKKMSRRKFGKMGGRFSIVSDQMAASNGGITTMDAGWAHKKHWEINVGFADGHVETHKATKDIAVTIPVSFGNDGAKTNSYVWRMFRCFDAEDFSDVAKRATWP
jgi:prepilin-type processing-associated H-X9-DG protein